MNRRWMLRCVMLVMLVLSPAGCGDRTHQAVTLGGRTFKLELALDDAARTKGLKYRDHIADDGGMLFVFPQPRVLWFWMNNCKTDIDVIFLDASGRIVSIRKMTAPDPSIKPGDLPQYGSEYPAQFAIEVQGGLTDKLALKLGEKVGLATESLKRLAR
ncbi:MAG: DUF192 domain-containing protein [Phycisphaerales bacterium]